MKICLIIPPSVFLLDERVFMTLGILKVAAVLERENIDVDVIDCSGIKNYQDVVRDYCRVTDTMIFGITATTPQLPAAINIAKTIRSSKKNAKIILGGPHVTLVNSARKSEERNGLAGRINKAFSGLTNIFDVLVAGDGEESIFVAIGKNAPKLIDADIPNTNLFLTNNQLEELPFPARHLVDVESYHYLIDGYKALSIIAQLGCPFQCGFCGGRKSQSLRKIRTRSSQNIVGEIVHIYKKTAFADL